jgi:tRNA-2-methylthio-N6-dimethylallyladenosine synthase
MDQQVAEDIKSARLTELQALLNSQQVSFNSGCVGRVMPVLFERPGRDAGQLVGRSPYLQSVHVSAASDQLGEIVPVHIEHAGPNSLAGRVEKLAA